VGELTSAYNSVMLVLYFGAPALEELPVLDFPACCLLVILELMQPCRWGETAVIDTGRRAACH